MPTAREIYGAAPFEEAVEFFRKKLNMPSNRWDDLWKEQHAKGFMVAGATKAELLAGLRSAVDAAISKGESLQDFRSRFDDIVEKHGWKAKGNRNWRTRVIYNTNMRTAYMAGRYQQMTHPDVIALRPYWQYRHGDSRHPRPLHLSWDKLVLRHDDPWWDTHYTPNGWGCRCRIISLSQRDMERKGLTPGTAPDDGTYQWKDKAGNTHTIPVGIDPGWDYNVGKASGHSFKSLTEKFETLPNDIARSWMADYLTGPAFQYFFDGAVAGEFPVAVLATADQAVLESKAQTVWMSKETLEVHKAKHPEITIEDYRKIPEILDNGEVYKQDDTRLIYLKLDGKLYRAALKRTKDGSENYFLTLFEADIDRADRQVRNKYERIR